MIEQLVRKNILNLKPYQSARTSFSKGVLLDANENSFGSVVENNLSLNRYPDPLQSSLRDKLSKILNLNADNLFLGVGSDEIIDLLIRIFCTPGKDSVLITEPTYGMYRVACNINDVNILTVPLNNRFQIDVKKTLSKVTSNTKLIFLCSPNNPTGNLLNKKSIQTLLKKFNGIIIVDEAYIDFSEENSLIHEVKNYKNLVIIRTFSKAWGLAGIRAGYAVANDLIIKLLFKIKAPYNLSKLTSQMITEALDNISRKKQLVKKLNTEKTKLSSELRKLRCVQKVYNSDANFILFRIKNAKQVYKKLSSEGIIIRDRSSQLNLYNCLRVTVGTPEENKLFISKLKEIL